MFFTISNKIIVVKWFLNEYSVWHYERWILILWENQNYNYSNNKKSGQKSKVIPWVLLIWVRVFF